MSASWYAVAASVACSLAPGHAVAFPLEWNATYDTSVPREVEIQPAKLLRCGLMRPGDGFDVFADDRRLSVVVLDGKSPESVRLRFSVPHGTRKLKLRGQALQGARFLWGWILGDRPCAIAP